jgi:bifunctional non-homologous end joining protein LigD
LTQTRRKRPHHLERQWGRFDVALTRNDGLSSNVRPLDLVSGVKGYALRRRTVANMKVEGAMQTPDGEWRVEIVRRGRDRWYRIVHGDDVIDRLSIATVQRILAEADVDVGDLVDVDVA